MRTKWTRQVCVLLPNKQRLDCRVRVKARGQEVLGIVLRRLSVSDLQVFGLAVLRENEYLFLDLDRKLNKYFGKKWSRDSLTVPFTLFLRVRFFVESGLLILSSKMQQLYYAELRQKVLRSQSQHQEALFFQLAASALQAEVGDLLQREDGGGGETKEERMLRHYFLPEDYFPSWLIKRRGRDYLLKHCPVLHGELRGASRSRAILQFIRQASGLEDGATTFYRMRQYQASSLEDGATTFYYRMRQDKKELKSFILLGVAVTGVQIYQEVEGKRSALFDCSWTDIDRFTFQGRRFEIAAVGSLYLSKLVYYTHSAFHSKHVLKHLCDSHRFHIHTRDAVSYLQQLEDTQASHSYKEAYICDPKRLKQKLRCHDLASSMSDCSGAAEAVMPWTIEEEEEEDEGSPSEAKLWLDQSEEAFVDDPAEVSWLSELLYGASVDGPLLLSTSPWAAVTTEMKQVLWNRTGEEASVD